VENANLPDYTMQNSVKTRAYAGNKIFENGSLDKILLPNGYIQNNIYYFYLRDHLGSNCVTAKADGTVMQGLQYYPYGRVNEDESTGVSFQPYKYGGKEDEPMHGLGLLDFHARQLSYRDVPVFTGMDRHAESYYSISPYAAMACNPIRYADPTGMDSINVNDNGLIAGVYTNDGNNRFFDKSGNELIFNDPKNADQNMFTNRNFAEGDRVFMNVSRKDAFSAIKSVSQNSDILNGGADYYLNIRNASNREADFTFNYLVGYYNKNRNSEFEMAIPEDGLFRPHFQEDFVYFKFEGESRLYNLYDSGNFMWGAWSQYIGLSNLKVFIGSNLNEWYNYGDSRADQRAIFRGRKWMRR
jgi:RHS repeat-associated protein